MKEGKQEMWYSITPKEDLPLELFDAESTIPSLEEQTFDLDIAKTKINIKELENFVRSWFNKAEIMTHNIIYLPVYEITYLEKDSERTIYLNAYTKKRIEV